MRNEAPSAKVLPPLPGRPRKDSGEYPIGSTEVRRGPSSRRDPASPPSSKYEYIAPDDVEMEDEEISAKDLEEISRTEEGRILAMRQAKELAKEFPGLVVDDQERRTRGTLAMHRAAGLEDDIHKMEKKKEQLRGSGKRVGLRSESMLITGLDKDQEETQGALEKATEEMTKYNAYPDAKSEIASMIGELQERRERVQNNSLTVRGIDAKIDKLNRLSALLDKAKNYEHPDDIARYRKDKIEKDRIRAHEIWKTQNKPREIPAKWEMTEQEPEWEPTEEQRALWAEERRASGKRVAEGARNATRRPYMDIMKAHEELLIDVAGKLASQGIVVDLPGQVAKFTAPKESTGSKIWGFLSGKPKADSTRDLMERYRRSAQAYVDAQKAMEKL